MEMPFLVWTQVDQRNTWSTFGGHTWACPGLPVVDILNAVCKGAAYDDAATCYLLCWSLFFFSFTVNTYIFI